MHYLDYNEKRRHGTPEFPIEFYHVTGRHPRYHMQFHWHKEIEIVRVLKGTLSLCLNSCELTAAAGDIVFINEGVIHGGTPCDAVYQCVVFDMPSLLMNVEACRRYIRQIRGQQIQVNHYFAAGGDERDDTRGDSRGDTRGDSRGDACGDSQDVARGVLSGTVGRLFETMEQQPEGYELIAAGLLYELFGLIFQNHYYHPADSNGMWGPDKLDRLKTALEYIDNNFSSGIRLKDLSMAAGMSTKYLCRCFQAVVHRSPIEYLNFYRIERACDLFSTTDQSITETAYACGFNDTSYFVKTFKKFKEVTPRQYQKLCGKESNPQPTGNFAKS